MTLEGETAAKPLPHTAGVVLCGGQSLRMGMPKAWLPCGSEVMLQRVVRLMSEVCSPMVVVTSADQTLPTLEPTVAVAHDRNHDQGPLEGLAVALGAIGDSADTAMVVACDVPLLRAALVRHLVDCVQGYDAVVPLVEGRPHPLVAVYRTHVHETIERRLRSGHLKLRDFLGEINVRYVEVDELKSVDPTLESLQNINQPEEYRSFARQLGFEVPTELRREPE